MNLNPWISRFAAFLLATILWTTIFYAITYAKGPRDKTVVTITTTGDATAIVKAAKAAQSPDADDFHVKVSHPNAQIRSHATKGFFGFCILFGIFLATYKALRLGFDRCRRSSPSAP